MANATILWRNADTVKIKTKFSKSFRQDAYDEMEGFDQPLILVDSNLGPHAAPRTPPSQPSIGAVPDSVLILLVVLLHTFSSPRKTASSRVVGKRLRIQTSSWLQHSVVVLAPNASSIRSILSRSYFCVL